MQKEMTLKPVGEILSKVIENCVSDKTNSIISTGFKKLDFNLRGGIHSDDLVVIGGRDGTGKTALILQILSGFCMKNQEKKILYFSFDLSSELLVKRLLAQVIKVENLDLLALGKLNDESIEKIWRFGDCISKSGLMVCDAKGFGCSELYDILLAEQKNKNSDLIIIDGYEKINGKKEIQVSLKELAKKMNTPIVVLCKTAETEINKRPVLGDLEECGEVVDEADTVIFLFRENYYFEKIKSYSCKTEVIIAKNVYGQTEINSLNFDRRLYCFEEI